MVSDLTREMVMRVVKGDPDASEAEVLGVRLALDGDGVLVNAREASLILGISRPHFFRERARGRLRGLRPAVRRGQKDVKYRLMDVREVLAKQGQARGGRRC